MLWLLCYSLLRFTTNYCWPASEQSNIVLSIKSWNWCYYDYVFHHNEDEHWDIHCPHAELKRPKKPLQIWEVNGDCKSFISKSCTVFFFKYCIILLVNYWWFILSQLKTGVPLFHMVFKKSTGNISYFSHHQFLQGKDYETWGEKLCVEKESAPPFHPWVDSQFHKDNRTQGLHRSVSGAVNWASSICLKTALQTCRLHCTARYIDCVPSSCAYTVRDLYPYQPLPRIAWWHAWKMW